MDVALLGTATRHQGGLTPAFFDAVVDEAFTTGLCSEHFSVDGILIESFASAKSFQPKPEKGSGDTGLSVTDTQASPPYGNGFKPGNPDVDFHGGKRTNDTHRSRTDPETKLYRKGKESKLSQMGHALNENRHGLIVAKRRKNGSPPKETPRSSTRC